MKTFHILLTFSAFLLVGICQARDVKVGDVERDTLTVPAPFVTDIREVLIGETPGVVAVSSPGKPGMTPTVYIRGIHPFQQHPAYYVDGVQVFDLGFLAPESVEKIEVLSGAEAVQRFGPSASCGALSVTTKRATARGFHASYSFSGAVQQLAWEPAQITLDEWKKYNEYYSNATQNPYLVNRYGASFAQIHHLNLQSGGEKLDFAASVDFLDNDGPMQGRGDSHRRFSGTARLDYQPLEWFRIEISAAAGRSNVSSLNVLNTLLYNSPVLAGQQATDPFHASQTTGTALSAQAKLEFRPIEGLYVRGLFGMSRDNTKETSAAWNWKQFGVEAGYARTFGKHSIGLDAGFKLQNYQYSYKQENSQIQSETSRKDVWTDVSARLNYDWNKRLFADFGVYLRKQNNSSDAPVGPSFSANLRWKPGEHWALFGSWSQAETTLYPGLYPYIPSIGFSPRGYSSRYSTLNAGAEASIPIGKSRIEARINGFLDKDTYFIFQSQIGLQNLGLELSANLSGHSGDVRFDTGFSLTLYRNKVNQLFERIESFNYRDLLVIRKDYPVGAAWLYPFTGVNPNNGSPELGTERQNFGQGLFPSVVLGLHGSVSWRNWQLSIRGHGDFGQSIFRTVLENSALTRHYLENSWRTDNPGAKYPAFGYENINSAYRQSSAMLHSGSFFRIDQIRLDYSLSFSRLPARVNLFASLENFFLFSSYPGSDPEYALDWQSAGLETGSIPSTKRIVFGVKVGF